MSDQNLEASHKKLNDIFQCIICMEKLDEPHLCPRCSKACCHKCFIQWLTSPNQRKTCPNCRCRLNTNNLVKCRWLGELQKEMERLSVQSETKKDQQEEANNENVQAAEVKVEEGSSIEHHGKFVPFSFPWIQSDCYSEVPSNALIAGADYNNSPIYVGRTSYKGNDLPVKIIPHVNKAYAPYNGQEIPVCSYEILCDSGFNWVSSSNGDVPSNAVKSGTNSSGETLYIGRAQYKGNLFPGKVIPSRGCLYLPYGGSERKMFEYEVLVKSAEYVKFSSDKFIGGVDTDGDSIYVGRAFHQSYLVAAIIFNKDRALISFDGKCIPVNDFEILCNDENYYWIDSGSENSFPVNAVSIETANAGNQLYIGRGYYKGTHIPGTIYPFEGYISVPYDGEEIILDKYEILARCI